MGLLPHPGHVSPRRRRTPLPACCPSCGSTFVQPQGWKELAGGDLLIHLRCAECMVLSSAALGQREVEELDDALVRNRKAIIADYERLVRHNMVELLHSFRGALERDLIGADDFGPRRAAQPSG